MHYAGNELRALLNEESREHAEALDAAPAVDLSGARLWGVSWSGLDVSWLPGRSFVNVDLRAATLTGSAWGQSRLSGARLQCAALDGASFTGPDTSDRRIDVGSDLTGADLRGAGLAGADLRGADLTGARLRGADLEDADLRGAVLKDADLTGATVTGIRTDGPRQVQAATGFDDDSVRPPALDSLVECLAKYWAP